MKTVLITGASRGIGRATAIKFAKNGYNVIINYNKSKTDAEKLLLEVKKYSNGIIYQADVSNYNQVAKMIQNAEDYFGEIDTLVCNAGISICGLYTDTTEQDFDNICNINIKGVYNTTRLLLPNMASKHRGNIVIVSSIWGHKGSSCEALYSMTKHAVNGLMKSLAEEYGPSGIQINSVSPGYVNTDMNAHYSKEDVAEVLNNIPLGRICEPEEIADAIYFVATNTYMNGADLHIDGAM